MTPESIQIFANRCDAGRQLAQQLLSYRGEDLVVVGLSRGGVPVAYEIADALDAPLDVLVVDKVRTPHLPELALGAVAPDAIAMNDEVVRTLDLEPSAVEQAVKRSRAVVDQRLKSYREDRVPVPLAQRTVIIVDDGIATGATTLAAVRSVRSAGAARVIVAAPTCAREAVAHLKKEVDRVVCVESPADFRAVGLWYEDFTQVKDAEVVATLRRAHRERTAHKTHPAKMT